MAWADLTNDDVPNFGEIEDAVNTAVMQWTGCVGPGPGTYEASEVFTRGDFQSEIESLDMSGSGLATNDAMTKGEMLTWANTAPGSAPTIHSISSLTNYRVSCQIEGYICKFYPSFELWRSDGTQLIAVYNGGSIGEVATTFQLDSSYQDVPVRFRARFRNAANQYGPYSSWSNVTIVSGGMG